MKLKSVRPQRQTDESAGVLADLDPLTGQYFDLGSQNPLADMYRRSKSALSPDV